MMINNKIKDLRQTMTHLINSSLSEGMPIAVIELVLETLLAEVARNTEKACQMELQQQAQPEQREVVEGEPVE